jgi:hypothetical protein
MRIQPSGKIWSDKLLAPKDSNLKNFQLGLVNPIKLRIIGKKWNGGPRKFTSWSGLSDNVISGC